jgi:hypothetical protein
VGILPNNLDPLYEDPTREELQHSLLRTDVDGLVRHHGSSHPQTLEVAQAEKRQHADSPSSPPPRAASLLMPSPPVVTLGRPFLPDLRVSSSRSPPPKRLTGTSITGAVHPPWVFEGPTHRCRDGNFPRGVDPRGDPTRIKWGWGINLPRGGSGAGPW